MAHYATMAMQQADSWRDLASQIIAGKLRYYLDVTTKIISQTERRVLRGETVPAHEKVVSLFEEHTGIIKKKQTVVGDSHFLYSLLLTMSRKRHSLIPISDALVDLSGL